MSTYFIRPYTDEARSAPEAICSAECVDTWTQLHARPFDGQEIPTDPDRLTDPHCIVCGHGFSPKRSRLRAMTWAELDAEVDVIHDRAEADINRVIDEMAWRPEAQGRTHLDDPDAGKSRLEVAQEHLAATNLRREHAAWMAANPPGTKHDPPLPPYPPDTDMQVDTVRLD